MFNIFSINFFLIPWTENFIPLQKLHICSQILFVFSFEEERRIDILRSRTQRFRIPRCAMPILDDIAV